MKFLMDMITYGMTMMRTPYIWAGNTPLAGMDCGGLVCELLRSQGYIRYNEDLSSQMLYDRFARTQVTTKIPERNDLIFFGKSEDKITHVAVAIDEKTMLEAGGGDSSTRTMKEAISRNAMVRVRPINYRKDFITAVSVQ